MIYLLDVNVLLAMGYTRHVHHVRTMRWLANLKECEKRVTLATCSITELGFVRIAGNKNANLARNVATARLDLRRVKEDWTTSFLVDSRDAAQLPSWVERPRHVTDGHLIGLATAHGGLLITLDSGIPGALLIPDQFGGPTMVSEPTIPYRVEKRYASHAD